jgi:predicted DNA-binding transcriptional regulator YafY
MKRDARLYDIVQVLRDGRLHTASELALRLGVSTRTIWRDMEMLALTGLSVSGERGLGYILRSPLVLPPTMLTPEELEALVEGLRHVGQEGNPRAKAARSLLYKVATLLPQSGIEADGQGQRDIP